MKIYLTILLFTLLVACSSKQSNNAFDKNVKSSIGFVKDTLFNGYQTKIYLKTEFLIKGIENDFNIKINDIPKEQILIYTKTSEASVKLKENYDFILTPTKTCNKVTVFINIQKDGQVIKIGEIELKTK